MYAWLTLSEIFGVCESKLLRWIFEPGRGKVTRGWRKLHTEELHNSYSSSNISAIKSRRMRWTGHDVAHTGEMRNIYGVLVRKAKGKTLCSIASRRVSCR
jgi:hypothetical protein